MVRRWEFQDHPVPLRATDGLIQEQQIVHEALGEVLAARVLTQKHAINSQKDGAAQALASVRPAPLGLVALVTLLDSRSAV